MFFYIFIFLPRLCLLLYLTYIYILSIYKLFFLSVIRYGSHVPSTTENFNPGLKFSVHNCKLCINVIAFTANITNFMYILQVEYDVVGFLDKNRDTLPPSVQMLMKSK